MLDLEHERLRRWRLVLGKAAEENSDQGDMMLANMEGGGGETVNPSGLSEQDQRLDRTLATLYGDGDSDEGDLSDPDPDIARWLEDVRTYFPSPVAHILQQDMLKKSNLRKLMADPEFLEYVEPDVGACFTDFVAPAGHAAQNQRDGQAGRAKGRG